MPGGTAPARGPLVAAVPRRAECLGARDTLSGPFLPLGPWISGRFPQPKTPVCLCQTCSLASCCLSVLLSLCPSLSLSFPMDTPLEGA